MALCKLCGQSPATVPDRNSMSPRKAVCRECHTERLRGDVEALLARVAQAKTGHGEADAL